MNNAFVEVVRQSGGGNADRLLCLVTPDYNRPESLDTLQLPDDDQLILTVHSYKEIENTWQGKPADPEMDYVTPTDAYFEALVDFTERTGIPFIIGETCVTHKETAATRAQRAGYFFGKSRETGIPALWWEDYFTTDDGYYGWLYDISNQRFGDPEIVEAIKSSLGDRNRRGPERARHHPAERNRASRRGGGGLDRFP